MTTTDIIMIIAIFSGPIVAVQLQKYLENYREIKLRKIHIYKILMSTRAARLSENHIVALNSIDLEFNEKKYSKVKKAWKVYLNHLHQTTLEDNKESELQWNDKADSYLCNLLIEMGNSLKFNFDEVDIKNNIYSPIGNDFIEKEIKFMRQGINQVLLGERTIKINIDSDETTKEV